MDVRTIKKFLYMTLANWKNLHEKLHQAQKISHVYKARTLMWEKKWILEFKLYIRGKKPKYWKENWKKKYTNVRGLFK